MKNFELYAKTAMFAAALAMILAGSIWAGRALVRHFEHEEVPPLQAPVSQPVIQREIDVSVELVPSAGQDEHRQRKMRAHHVDIAPHHDDPNAPGKWFAGPNGWEWVAVPNQGPNGAPVLE